jgi:hypothetical protein
MICLDFRKLEYLLMSIQKRTPFSFSSTETSSIWAMCFPHNWIATCYPCTTLHQEIAQLSCMQLQPSGMKPYTSKHQYNDKVSKILVT